MKTMLVALIVAAGLEIGGDAAIRAGLIRSSARWLLLGAILLVTYGFVVNTSRSIDFGKLLGVYIAVFFVVSQLVSLLVFNERPSPSLIFGGALIVLGGLIIQFEPLAK